MYRNIPGRRRYSRRIERKQEALRRFLVYRTLQQFEVLRAPVDDDVDTDDDNLKDGTEDTNHNGRIDGDNGDGMYGESETWTETSPNEKDSNGDTFTDKEEKNWGYNPLSQDTDHDGLLDNEEDKTDSGTKGFLDSGETDPTKKDTDGDELSDGQEKEGWNIVIYYEATGEEIENYIIHSDPRDTDTDDDGLNDMYEYQNQTDPTEADTDGDGKTDIQEINGGYDSSPTGMDGEPPEIWHYDCKYEIKETQLLLLKVPSGLEVWMEVGARDIFGVDNIEILISGLEDKKVFTDNDDNVTVEFEWELSGIDEYKRAFFDGFKINVTATDRNGNIGFKNEKLDSIKDLVISTFIGALKAISNVISSLLSMLMDLIMSIIETIFTKAINLFIDGIGIIAEPALDMIIDLSNCIFGMDLTESTKYEDPEGTAGPGGWQLSFWEAVSIIDLIFSVYLLGGTVIMGIMIAYLAAKAAASAVTAGSAQAATSLIDKVVAIVCPVVLYGILGAIGISLSLSSGYNIIDGYLPENEISSFIGTIGIAGDIGEGVVSAVDFIAKLLSAAATAGWSVKASITFIKTGNNGVIFIMGITTLLLTVLFKSGRYWTPPTPEAELGVSLVLAIFAFISLILWFTTTLSPQKYVWKEVFAPMETIMDLMCVGFCVASIASFMYDMFHYTGDRYPWD